MKIVVIGGTGAGGRAVVQALRAAGHTVAALARGQTPGPAPDLVCDRFGAQFAPALGALNPDAVVDQVAYGPEAVRATLAAVPPSARYVLMSSVIVYGPGRRRPYAEAEPARPVAGLAIAKRAAEEVLAGRPGATCLRLGALYGPGHAPMTPFGRDPGVIERLHAGQALVVPEPDPPVLQPLFAGDLGRVVADVLAEPSPPPLLNVAGPALMGWAAWYACWAEALGAPPPVLRRLTPAALAEAAPPFMRPFLDALLDPPRLALDRLRARGATLTGVRDGVRQTVAGR